MGTQQLQINVHPEVFKVEDPRVLRMRGGRLTTEAFAFLITPEDPFVLIKDTIYLLTEQEFYALRAAPAYAQLDDTAFMYVIGLPDVSFMEPADIAYIAKVRESHQGCTACRYRHFKQGIQRIANKYKLVVPRSDVPDVKIVEYPKISEPIVSKIPQLLRPMYQIPYPERKPCVDCVEKHVAQAWVLAGEVVAGYTDHIALVAAHLGEAVDEVPKQLAALRDTLEFCLARTNLYRKPFVPIRLILPLIDLARLNDMETYNHTYTEMPADATMVLDFDEGLKKELEDALKDTNTYRLCGMLQKADDIILEYKKKPSQSLRVMWEGVLGTIEGECAFTAPGFAKMVRNRRLLFLGDPGLAAEADYGFSDIVMCLNGLRDAG